MRFSKRKKRLEILVYRDGSIYVEGNRIFNGEDEAFICGMLAGHIHGFFEQPEKEEAEG